MVIDSGATETVVGSGMLESVETLEGDAYKKGVQHEVARGTLIPALGEKRLIAFWKMAKSERCEHKCVMSTRL